MSLKTLAVQVVCAAFALSCGALGLTAPSSGPVDGSPSGSLQLTASPEPVAAGALLTYTVKVGGEHSLPGASPRILVHLPEGVSDFRNLGAGWVCRKASSEADLYQAADHQHADCMTAIVGGGLPALKLEVEMPLGPGSIRACAEGGVKALRESACVTTTIVQGPP